MIDKKKKKHLERETLFDIQKTVWKKKHNNNNILLFWPDIKYNVHIYNIIVVNS